MGRKSRSKRSPLRESSGANAPAASHTHPAAGAVLAGVGPMTDYQAMAEAQRQLDSLGRRRVRLAEDEARAVRRARGLGFTWDQISTSLGVHRETLRRRYGQPRG